MDITAVDMATHYCSKCLIPGGIGARVDPECFGVHGGHNFVLNIGNYDVFIM